MLIASYGAREEAALFAVFYFNKPQAVRLSAVTHTKQVALLPAGPLLARHTTKVMVSRLAGTEPDGPREDVSVCTSVKRSGMTLITRFIGNLSLWATLPFWLVSFFFLDTFEYYDPEGHVRDTQVILRCGTYIVQ